MRKVFLSLLFFSIPLFSVLNWTPPEQNSVFNGVEVFNPFPQISIGPRVTIASDAAGNALYCWEAPNLEGLYDHFRANTLTWDGAAIFAPTQQLIINNATPDVAMNNAGLGIVAWAGSFRRIYARRLAPTFQAGTPTVVSQKPFPAFDDVADAEIGIDSAGVAPLSWIWSNTTPFPVVEITNFVGAGFPPVIFSSRANFSSLVTVLNRLAVNEAGRAIALWNNRIPFGVLETMISYYDGISWTPAIPIVPGVPAFEGNVAIDSTNIGYYIFNPDPASSAVVGTYDGSTLTTTTISPPGTSYNARVTASNGRAFAIWRNITNPAATFVEVSRYNGTIWEPPITISATGDAVPFGFAFDFAVVGMDAATNAIATWQRLDLMNNTSYIESAQYTASTDTWTGPFLIDTLVDPDRILYNQAITMNELGSVIAAWLSVPLPGGQTGTAFSSFIFVPGPPSGGVKPPSNFSGCCDKNEFLTQIDHFKVLTWSPSPSSNVVSYQLFRLQNGTPVLIATIPADCPLCFEDHNQNCVNTYQVRAVASNGDTSDPICFTI